MRSVPAQPRLTKRQLGGVGYQFHKTITFRMDLLRGDVARELHKIIQKASQQGSIAARKTLAPELADLRAIAAMSKGLKAPKRRYRSEYGKERELIESRAARNWRLHQAAQGKLLADLDALDAGEDFPPDTEARELVGALLDAVEEL